MADIVHHTDGEEGPVIGLHVELPDGSWIWCGELTDARVAELSEEAKDELAIKTGGGWLLEVGDKTDRRTLARVAGEEEALQLVTVLRDHATHDARVTELLEANNREVARRRQAEGGALDKPLLGCRTLGELLEAAGIIEELRQDEAVIIELFHDNPDFIGPSAGIDVSWDYDLLPKRYSGETVLEALRAAKVDKDNDHG